MSNYIYTSATPVDEQPSIYLYAWRILEVILKDETTTCLIGVTPGGSGRVSTEIVSLKKQIIEGNASYSAITLSGRVYSLTDEGFNHDSKNMSDVIDDVERQSKAENFMLNFLTPEVWNEKYGKANIH